MRAVLILPVFCVSAIAQEPSVDSVDAFQESVEAFLTEGDVDDEDVDEVDRLTYLSENPLDLNEAGFNELQQIPGISLLLAYRIISARALERFRSAAELLAIEGFDDHLYRSILPFVIVPPTHAIAPFSVKVRSRVLGDIQRREGYQKQEYAGGREKLYSRILFTAPLLEIGGVGGGVTTEKDPGERLENGFVSGYFSVTLPSFTVLAGDFVVSSGNDHILARGFATGRRQLLRHEVQGSIKGYQSTNEQRFFRGVGMTGILSSMSFGLFYSNKSMHGTSGDDGSLNPSGTGLFRTESELSRRDISRERVAGGYLSFECAEGISFSLTGLDSRFLTREMPVRSFGVCGAWGRNDASLSGELAFESDGGRSYSAEGSFEPLSGFTLVARHEAFTRGFSGLYGLARSPVKLSSSDARVDFRLPEGSRLSASLYRDDYPEGRLNAGFSEHAHGMTIEGVVSILPYLGVDARFKMKQADTRSDATDSFGRTRSITPVQRIRKFRIGVTAGRRTTFAWISRIEVSKADGASGGTSPGIMLSQEFRYMPSSDLRIQAKLTVFAIENYDGRIYSSEPVVPGMIVSRALLGEGTRSAISLLYRMYPGFEVSGSFSTEVQDGRRSLGSGLESIRGNKQSRLTFQIDLRL